MADTVQEIAFRYAVDRVNNDHGTLPKTRLTAQIERIPAQDSFYAAKQGNNSKRKKGLNCSNVVSVFKFNLIQGN